MRIKQAWWILAILVAGALLRLWGIGFGLPFQFHQDEPIVVNHALAYGTGDLNPHFFIIPPLASYILFIFYAFYFVILKLFACIPSAEAFAISFFQDPTPFYLIARITLGFIPGVINIYLTYKLAAKVFSLRCSLYCALLSAVTLLNVLNAHYAYTDTLLVMWIQLVFLQIFSFVDKPSMRASLLAGLFMGAAVATKYNAALLVIPMVVACVWARISPRSRVKNILVCACFTALAFVACNPFAILDMKFFLMSVTGRIGHGVIGFNHHITYSLFEGASSIVTILGIAGLVLALIRKPKYLVPVFSFIVCFYLHLTFASQPYPRYALAIVPFLCLGLGFLLFDYLYPRFTRPGGKALLIVAAFAAIIPTLSKSVVADSLLAQQDSRISAVQWIEKNIPPESLIALDSTFFGPPLRQTTLQLHEKEKIFGKQAELAALKSKKLQLQLKAAQPRAVYNVYYLIEGGESSGQFLGFWPVLRNTMAQLREEKIEYVIFNNTLSPASTRALRDEVAKTATLIAVFDPYWDKHFRRPFDTVEFTCLPIETEELFSRRTSGPYLEIYKLP